MYCKIWQKTWTINVCKPLCVKVPFQQHLNILPYLIFHISPHYHTVTLSHCHTPELSPHWQTLKQQLRWLWWISQVFGLVFKPLWSEVKSTDAWKEDVSDLWRCTVGRWSASIMWGYRKINSVERARLTCNECQKKKNQKSNVSQCWMELKKKLLETWSFKTEWMQPG